MPRKYVRTKQRVKMSDGLTPEQVVEIFLSEEGSQACALQYGINDVTVRHIRNGKVRREDTAHLPVQPRTGGGFGHVWKRAGATQQIKAAQSAGATKRWEAYRQYKAITGSSDRSVGARTFNKDSETGAKTVMTEWSALALRARQVIVDLHTKLAANPDASFANPAVLDDLRKRIEDLETLIAKWSK